MRHWGWLLASTAALTVTGAFAGTASAQGLRSVAPAPKDKADEKKLYEDMIAAWSDYHLKNAINAILTWKRRERPAGLLHLHGDKDHTLPVKFTRPDHVLAGGGHLMVYSRPDEVSAWLASVLA